MQTKQKLKNPTKRCLVGLYFHSIE